MFDFNFTIGADPEFSLNLFNNRVNAHNTMDKFFQEKEEGQGFNIPGYGNAGWDGCDATGEIRPLPSNDPNKVTDNIGKLLETIHNKMPFTDMITTNEQAPVGGHMHFLLPEGITAQAVKKLVHKLDTLFIPVMLGQNIDSENIRFNGSYGKLHDYRVDEIEVDAKQRLKLEYRTPNAEWITTRKVCHATLCYMATCYNQIINHPKTLNDLKQILLSGDKQTNSVQNLIMSNYKPGSEALLKVIKKTVRKFKAYKEYKQEIEYILSPDKVQKDKKATSFNIAIGWGMAKQETFSKKIVKQATVLSAKTLEEFNLDNVGAQMAIAHNKELNCESFALRLGALLATKKIKQNNEYFIFGMRKGIDKPMAMRMKDNAIIYGQEQIKTLSDLDVSIDTLSRMKDKARENIKINSAGTTKPVIILGLPYMMRVRNKFQEFVNLIYELEQIKPDGIGLDNNTLVNDYDLSYEERGELYKLYQKSNDIQFDTSSQGARMARDARQRIMLSN